MDTYPSHWTSDKMSLGYLPNYRAIRVALGNTFLMNDTETVLRVLEVGVAGGGGLAMFRDVFDTDQVFGVDIDPNAGTELDRHQGLVLVASQRDPGLPLVVEQRWGTFHLIVDDASHLAEPTSETLSLLWRLVRPGGFYVIEDWNYLEAAGMAQNLWQKIFGWWMAYPSVDLREKPRAPYSGMLEGIASATVRDGMIILRKRV